MTPSLTLFDVAHFRFCREGGGQQISPGNRSGGSRHRRGGHAATAWRSARVSRPRRLARPPGLPRSSQTPVSEVFVLAKLTPKRRRPIGQAFGLGQRPAPSAGAFRGGVQRTTAQHQKAGSTVELSGEHGGISRVSLDWVEEPNACIECRVDAYPHLGARTRPAPTNGDSTGSAITARAGRRDWNGCRRLRMKAR